MQVSGKRITGALVVLAAAVVTVLALAPAALCATDFTNYDSMIDNLGSKGYAYNLMSGLNAYGENSMGMRLSGTLSGNAASKFVAGKMRSAGLKRVRLEAVPCDAFSLRGATVAVGNRWMNVSQFPGMPGTDADGITAEVVYVGRGMASDYVGKDVVGKIVLVDYDQSLRRLAGLEAKYQGAAAVIVTRNPAVSGTWASIAKDALISYDGEYQWRWVPYVFMSQQDGEWLKTQLAGAPVSATLRSSVVRTTERAGAVGYNVVGEIPGTDPTAPMVILSAHVDAYWRAAIDDTSGVAAMLQMAKAMRMSGYKPRGTIILLATAGEEFGHGNTHYDYLAGAWQAVSKTHPGWAGRVALDLNFEGIGMTGSNLCLLMYKDPALVPWFLAGFAESGSLLPGIGTFQYPGSGTADDGFATNVVGIPTMTTTVANFSFYAMYHTRYDSIENGVMDWTVFNQSTKFYMRLLDKFEKGVLPYNFTARSNDLAARAKLTNLGAAGVDATLVTRFQNDLAAFAAAATQYDAGQAAGTVKPVKKANVRLMRLEKLLAESFIALDQNDNMINPHEQLLKDVEKLNAAIAALDQATPDAAAALTALTGVDRTWLGVQLSYPAYQRELKRHTPDNPRLYWASRAKFHKFVDVMPQYSAIQAGQYATAKADLATMRDDLLSQLSERVETMVTDLEQCTTQLQALAAMGGN